jgi:hypothetical protein
LHLHLSLFSSLDLILEGVQEAGTDGGTLQKLAEVDTDQGSACRMRLTNQAVQLGTQEKGEAHHESPDEWQVDHFRDQVRFFFELVFAVVVLMRQNSMTEGASCFYSRLFLTCGKASLVTAF